MNKLLIASLVLVSTVFSKEVDPKIFNDMPFVKHGVVIQKVKDLGSIYFLHGVAKSRDGIIPVDLFVTKDKRYFVFGTGFDAKTNKKLSFVENFDAIKKKAAFTIGHGKDEYLLFTDPECPFCKKFEKNIPKLEQNATFYVFFYPLPFHKEAKPMSEFILSLPQEKRSSALYMMQVEGDESYKNKKLSKETRARTAKILEEHGKIARELYVRGTPTLLDKNFKKINWPDLLKKYGIRMPIDMRGVSYLAKNGGEVVMGKGNKDLYIVMDPECPHCQEMFRNGTIDRLKDKYTLHFLLYPGKKKDSRIKTAYLLVLDKNEKAVQLEKLMKGANLDEKTVSETKELMTKDAKVMRYLGSAPFVIRRMGVEKVPMAFDASGKPIEIEKVIR